MIFLGCPFRDFWRNTSFYLFVTNFNLTSSLLEQRHLRLNHDLFKYSTKYLLRDCLQRSQSALQEISVSPSIKIRAFKIQKKYLITGMMRCFVSAKTLIRYLSDFQANQLSITLKVPLAIFKILAVTKYFFVQYLIKLIVSR